MKLSKNAKKKLQKKIGTVTMEYNKDNSGCVNCKDCLCDVANLALEADDYDTAIEAMMRIPEKVRLRDSYCLYILGQIYEGYHHMKKAEEYFKKSYELGESSAAIGLGNVYNIFGEYNVAKEWYQIAFDNGHKQAGPFINKMKMKMKK